MIENFENKNIQSFEYSKSIISDGNIIGTCELGKAEIQMLNNTNQYNSLKEQWIKTIHGSFYIYDIEPVQEKISIKLLCYDIKYKLDTKYNSSLYTFPMTLKEWRNKIFDVCNLLYDDSDFPNSDLILSEEPYIGDSPTNREVIRLIAQAGCSWVDNDKNDIIYFKWFSETTHKVIDWLELTTETITSKKINVVTLGRGDVEDNISYPEQIPEDKSEFRIDNNYILDPQDTASEEDLRYETIIPIYNRVVDFSYLIFNIRTQDIEDRLNIKLGEKITYNDIWGNNLNAYIMSMTLKYIGGDVTDENNYELILSAEKINESSSELKYSSTIPNDILKVNRKTDKNAGLINDLVKKTDSQGTKITEISQSVDKINQSVSETSKKITSLEETIKYFSVDLDIYNLTIPVDSEYKSLEEKTYSINFYSYFKGSQITPVVNVSGEVNGIDINTSNTAVTLSVTPNTAIPNLNNEIVVDFTYVDGEEVYSLSKKIIVTLSLKGDTGATGADGQPGKDGTNGTNGKDGTDGKSAYQIWLDAGNTGTEEDYLNSLKGETGKTGPQGIQGLPGVDGISTYFYVKYSSDYSGSSMTDVPDENTKYMGTASTTSSTAPTSASAYKWSLIKGADGTNGSPGQAGVDGKTSYLHIKYSEDGVTFTPADEDYVEGEKPSAYIGQYVDNTEEDSTNFEDYKWYKFTEDIDDELNEMKTDISNNAVEIHNNYQELNEKLNEKASVENVTEVINRVDTLQSSTDYTITILEDIQVNGVSQVVTETGYKFDKDGMSVDKEGAPTGNRIDETGMEIVDKLTSALATLFFSGYVNEEISAKVDALTKYLGQTVTFTQSLIFQKYLSSMNMRFEDIEHEVFGKGLGFFTIGSDE